MMTEDLSDVLSTDDFAVEIVAAAGYTFNGILKQQYNKVLNVEGKRIVVSCATADLQPLFIGDTFTVDGVLCALVEKSVDGNDRALTRLRFHEKADEPAEPQTYTVTLSGTDVIEQTFIDEEYPYEPSAVPEPEGLHRSLDEVVLRNDTYDCHPIIQIHHLLTIPDDAVIDWAELYVYGHAQETRDIPTWIAYKILQKPLMDELNWIVYNQDNYWNTPGALGADTDYDSTPIIGRGMGFTQGYSKILDGDEFTALIQETLLVARSIVMHDSEETGESKFVRRGDYAPYLRIQYTVTP